MDDSTGNICFPGTSSRFPHSRQRSNSDAHVILPHLLAPLPCESALHPYLASGEDPQIIGVQFMPSCPAQDATQLDPDILQRHLTFDDDSSPAAAVAYPESSQRTTSHPRSPYASEASGFGNYADFAALHVTQAFRRGSWPSHSQTGYPSWMHSPPRIVRSPVSEPPESTSDESYQDSDVEEATQMSPMMSQFQIQSSRNVNLPPQHMYHAQALQPSVLTFQLSETMPRPVGDPENGQMLRSPPDMSVVGDDEPGLTHQPPSLAFALPFLTPSRLQGPGTRLQRESENAIQTSQFRVPAPSSDGIPSPSPHSPGDQRPSSFKQQKKSKMHQCPKCKKMFPRPSGLVTHMNTHSGAKPYKCIVESCEKSFAVRSNAKRHLRTHGISPSSSGALSRPRFTVGFEEPMVTQVHDVGRQPSRYRWIPHNPSPHEHEYGHGWPRQGSPSTAVDSVSHAAIGFQASTSATALSNGEDEDEDGLGSLSAADFHQSQGDYDGGDVDAEDFSGTYPIYGGRG